MPVSPTCAHRLPLHPPPTPLSSPDYARPDTRSVDEYGRPKGWVFTQALLQVLEKYKVGVEATLAALHTAAAAAAAGVANAALFTCPPHPIPPQSRFPWVFHACAASVQAADAQGQRVGVAAWDLFPDLDPEAAADRVREAHQWLKAQGVSRRPLVPRDSRVAWDQAVRALQTALPQRLAAGNPTIVEARDGTRAHAAALPIPAWLRCDRTPFHARVLPAIPTMTAIALHQHLHRSHNLNPPHPIPLQMDEVAAALLLPPLDARSPLADLAGGTMDVGDRVIAIAATGTPPFG